MRSVYVFVLVSAFVAVYLVEDTTATGGYGHGHKASGTACIVKGSYCNCHYCKCEKGHVHCGYGKGKCKCKTTTLFNHVITMLCCVNSVNTIQGRAKNSCCVLADRLCIG